MNTVLLERSGGAGSGLEWRRRRALLTVLRRLEGWLPAEEAALQRARAANRPLERREAEWRELLRLYERLSAALARERMVAAAG